ncbi:DUF1801 domain-containing protein [Yoonia sp. SS1-5]|uniref:DUF1801 domain-containing protein n=1 Tax=Yoonia rhodophyticola TaxID=3137370 RepID=A0AAN0MCY8_9RHOB
MRQCFESDAVRAVFDGMPAHDRETALCLRDLIFAVAAETPTVGPVEEALRWGQPAYLTPKTKSGSTLRIGLIQQGGCAIFAHCATDIISTYAAMFPGCDQIEGNRAVVFTSADAIEPARLRFLIYHGLTYHLKLS